MNNGQAGAERGALYIAVLVLIVGAIPLWREFSEPANATWNILFALILLATVSAPIIIARAFAARGVEVGEARFDTRNTSNTNG